MCCRCGCRCKSGDAAAQEKIIKVGPDRPVNHQVQQRNVDSHHTFNDEHFSFVFFFPRVSSNISVLTSCYFGGRNASPRNRFSSSQRPRHTTRRSHMFLCGAASSKKKNPTGNAERKLCPSPARCRPLITRRDWHKKL